ncbi:Metalloendoproteinase 3-MMP [Glycine soja]|uniref:Metalloendoproteinase 3-MMP n=1 Tax=Glycine soja TaxID=3848 RepID=A0A445LIQ2_GLYSO|nr:Metalloendoproteinase 3-MMP [Glycine soja]
MNFDYGFTGNVSWPKTRNRWFPERNHLTYGFDPASHIQPNMKKIFRDAFKRWAQATTGVFSLSFIILQPGSNVTTGDIRLKGAMLWLLPSENESLSWEDGVLDLESAAMHLLGLDHSNKEGSVMYPNVLPWQQRKVELSVSDM